MESKEACLISEEVRKYVAGAGVREDAIEGVCHLHYEVLKILGGDDDKGLKESPLSDPVSLLRFYDSREKNVADALKMYVSSTEWRKTYSIARVMNLHGSSPNDSRIYTENGGRVAPAAPWDWVRSGKQSVQAEFGQAHFCFGRMNKDTPNGEPLMVIRCGPDFKGMLREKVVDIFQDAFFSFVEEGLQAAQAASFAKGKMVQVRLIIDAKKLQLSALRYKGLINQINSIGSNVFPETFKTCTIVRAPWALTKLYKVMKLMMTKHQQTKLRVLGSKFEDELLEHAGVSLDLLPDFMGGGSSGEGICDVQPIPKGAGDELRKAIALQDAENAEVPVSQ